MLAVAILVAAALAVLAVYLARPTFVSGTSTGSSATTAHQQAPDAIERNFTLRGPVCDSSICNPNAGSEQVDRAASGETSGADSMTLGGMNVY